MPARLISFCLALLVALVVFVAGSSRAVAGPVLQLYIEGAIYDDTTETWELAPDAEALRLWAIGNLDGPGGKGDISDVKISAVYDEEIGPLVITLTPSTTGGFNGFTDPSTPIDPVHVQTVSDGSVPKLGDGSDLPNHGQYGEGRVWQEFALGDFEKPSDSPYANFDGSTNDPVPEEPDGAQINVYDISILGLDEFGGDHPFSIHFDLYNHVVSNNMAKYKFAPFSHDAGGSPDFVEFIPEPSSMTLMSIGLLGCCGIVGYRRRKQRKHATQSA